jgi:hypothetical protein
MKQESRAGHLRDEVAGKSLLFFGKSAEYARVD